MWNSRPRVIAVMTLARENKNRIALARQFQQALRNSAPDILDDILSDTPAAQVAFSHSRICATVTTGIGIKVIHSRTIAGSRANVNIGRRK